MYMSPKIYIFIATVLIFYSTVYCQIDIYSTHISLGSKVNSSYQELNCVISPNKKKLYFTRANHPSNVGGKPDKGDIWVSEMDISGNWTDAINLGKPLNDEKENKIIGFVNAGRIMILHSKSGIAFSNIKKGKWTKPSLVKIPYFKLKSEHQSGSISADGKYLLFGMESFGSYGVEDIYMSRLKLNEEWTSPKNLGRKINTEFEEQTPFITADNKTLFFASNGRGGNGSYDIFMATRLDDTWKKWTEPKNLGKLVNTKGQDFSFIFANDDEFAYLISTQNSDGYGDIKKVKIIPYIKKDTSENAVIEEPILLKGFIDFKGTVYDRLTKKPIRSAKLTIITIPDTIKYNVYTTPSGKFEVDIEKRTEYELKITAIKYMDSGLILTESDVNSSSLKEYYLDPLSKGNTIRLNHVLFNKGKDELVEGSDKQLDLLLDMLKNNPDIYIFLKGHTDNQGSGIRNLDLSNDRVVTVQKYLMAGGIERKRIKGQGYGGLKPIASNSTEETRKLNRRVEFTIQ